METSVKVTLKTEKFRNIIDLDSPDPDNPNVLMNEEQFHKNFWSLFELWLDDYAADYIIDDLDQEGFWPEELDKVSDLTDLKYEITPNP